MRAFPPEAEGTKSASILRELTPKQRYRLQALAEDEVTSAQHGTYVGLHADSEDEALKAQGLVAKARVDTGDSPSIVTRLTDKGLEAARLLSAVGEIPSWAEDVVSVERPFSPADDDIPF